MPDNTTKIATIEALLESGATSVTVDGVTTSIDPDSLRQELSRLRAADTTKQTARPRAAAIYLGGF